MDSCDLEPKHVSDTERVDSSDQAKKSKATKTEAEDWKSEVGLAGQPYTCVLDIHHLSSIVAR